jgi:uncharacterized protein YuzE
MTQNPSHITAKRICSATSEILLKIFQKTDDLFFYLNYPALMRNMSARAARQYLEYKSKGLPRPISQINKNGWIEIKKLNNEILIKITDDGKIAALQILISQKKKKLLKRTKLVVAFDVPELAKETRMMFRRSLKRMGFTQMQKSIWTTNYNVTKEMDQYIRLLKIDRWVLLLQTVPY